MKKKESQKLQKIVSKVDSRLVENFGILIAKACTNGDSRVFRKLAKIAQRRNNTLAAILLAFALLTPGCTKSPASANPIALATAYGLGVVSNGVLCPSTVHFQAVFCREKAPGFYVIQGTMDSQNRFGAMVRENFACGITNDNGTLSFTVAQAGDRYWNQTNFVDLSTAQ